MLNLSQVVNRLSVDFVRGETKHLLGLRTPKSTGRTTRLRAETRGRSEPQIAFAEFGRNEIKFGRLQTQLDQIRSTPAVDWTTLVEHQQTCGRSHLKLSNRSPHLLKIKPNLFDLCERWPKLAEINLAFFDITPQLVEHPPKSAEIITYFAGADQIWSSMTKIWPNATRNG